MNPFIKNHPFASLFPSLFDLLMPLLMPLLLSLKKSKPYLFLSLCYVLLMVSAPIAVEITHHCICFTLVSLPYPQSLYAIYLIIYFLMPVLQIDTQHSSILCQLLVKRSLQFILSKDFQQFSSLDTLA